MIRKTLREAKRLAKLYARKTGLPYYVIIEIYHPLLDVSTEEVSYIITRKVHDEDEIVFEAQPA